jgi:hypothetical protein
MLTGAIPIIWPWDGAREIWPEQYIAADIEQAVELIRKPATETNKVRDQLLELYQADSLTKLWLSVLQ